MVFRTALDRVRRGEALALGAALRRVDARTIAIFTVSAAFPSKASLEVILMLKLDQT